MNQNREISDELLARYLSGKCSAAEEAEVLEYLAQSDEHVDDLLNITAAVELQQQKQPAKKNPFLRWQTWAAAAVLMVALGGAYLFMQRGGDVNIDAAPVYAAQDTIDTDSVTCEELQCVIDG